MQIQALNSLEYSLYGAAGGADFYNLPTSANNYQMPMDMSMFYSPYSPYYPYSIYSPYNNTYNPTFNGGASQTTTNGKTPNPTEKDISTLADYYAKTLSPSQSLIGAVTAGTIFGSTQHPRIFAHPINTFSSIKSTTNMFTDVVKEGTKLNQLWTNPNGNELLREAYFRMNKIEARSKGKLGLFREKFSERDYNNLKNIMETALATGDEKKIAEATAKLRAGYVDDGLFYRTWDGIKKFFGCKTPDRSVDAAINDTAKITSELAQVTNLKSGTFKDAFKRGGGVKGAAFMALIEVLTSLGNISAAFKEDSKTGWTQIGQTGVKAIGNAASYAAGEALGIWGMGKLFAKFGSKIHPLWGTIAGYAAGLIVGSASMWLTGKITNKLVGEDVGAKAKAKQLAQTPQGQAELLQVTLQAAQNDKNLDPQVLQALQNFGVVQA
ncbi:hypothetical protein IJO12_00645 [bacterium]|nr:hypothetical protein [bacterium]